MTLPRGHAPASRRVAIPPFAASALRSPIVREIVQTFGTRVVLIAAGLVTSVITARILGPEGRGIVAVAAAASMLFVQFGNLGLHASNTYTVARRPDALHVLTANSLIASAVAGLLAGAVLVVLDRWVPSALAISGTMKVLVGVSVPFGIAYLLLQNLLIGVGRIRDYNGVELLVKLGGVGLLAALALAHGVTPARVFAITVVASAVGCIVVIPLLVQRAWHRVRPDVPILRSTLGYGARAYFSALFAYVTLRFDLLMVEHYRGPVDAGYYSIAASYGDLVYLLPTVVGTVLFPRLSALPSDAERWELTRRAMFRLGLAMIGAVALAAVVAPFLVRVLFGAAFLPAVPAILWLMPGLAVLSLNTLLMNYFASIGMPPVTIIAPAVAGTVNVLLNTILIPRFGIVGASAASTVAYGLMLVCSATYVATRREGA